MAKMVNPNKVSEMHLINARSEARQRELMQKIGREKRKMEATLSRNARSLLNTLVKEMTKQLKKEYGDSEKYLSNIIQFFGYMEKETEVTKENKKIKEKKLLLSYSEMDFVKFQLSEGLKKTEAESKKLKWYQFLKKASYKYSKTQMEIALEELNKAVNIVNRKKK